MLINFKRYSDIKIYSLSSTDYIPCTFSNDLYIFSENILLFGILDYVVQLISLLFLGQDVVWHTCKCCLEPLLLIGGGHVVTESNHRGNHMIHYVSRRGT